MEDDHRRPDWPLSGADDLRDELLAAYGSADRGYHDTGHLIAVLDRLAELSAAGVSFDPLPVTLAAWFHDAVYDGERDAEERSATWAELALPDHVDAATVTEVARLVRLTETHAPDPDDANGCALSDADLGILATDEATYAHYVSGVRHDYRHLPAADFTAGRTAVLSELHDRDPLFRTPYARESWTTRARDNLARELRSYGALSPSPTS